MPSFSIYSATLLIFLPTDSAEESAFVKNQGLGFAIPYFHNGQSHDYIPDFIIRLDTDSGESYLILETKGFDELESIKKAAAERWINAVNVDRRFGHWQYAVAKKPDEVRKLLDNARKL